MYNFQDQKVQQGRQNSTYGELRRGLCSRNKVCGHCILGVHAHKEICSGTSERKDPFDDPSIVVKQGFYEVVKNKISTILSIKLKKFFMTKSISNKLFLKTQLFILHLKKIT